MNRALSLDAADTPAFKDTLSRFATGVTIIATQADGQPIGFAAQSFQALSLDPPMVMFAVMKTSRSFPFLTQVGRFGVSVLGDDQAQVAEVFGRRGDNKFAQVDWSLSQADNPLIDGALAWFDCELDVVLDGGDHHVIFGRVLSHDANPEASGPLIYSRGQYAQLDRTQAPQPQHVSST